MSDYERVFDRVTEAVCQIMFGDKDPMHLRVMRAALEQQNVRQTLNSLMERPTPPERDDENEDEVVPEVVPKRSVHALFGKLKESMQTPAHYIDRQAPEIIESLIRHGWEARVASVYTSGDLVKVIFNDGSVAEGRLERSAQEKS